MAFCHSRGGTWLERGRPVGITHIRVWRDRVEQEPEVALAIQAAGITSAAAGSGWLLAAGCSHVLLFSLT